MAARKNGHTLDRHQVKERRPTCQNPVVADGEDRPLPVHPFLGDRLRWSRNNSHWRAREQTVHGADQECRHVAKF